MRNLRREILRAQLIQDDLDGGTVARDYLVFAQLRMLLTKAGPEKSGIRTFAWHGPVELREEGAGNDLIESCTAGLFKEQLERVRSWRCFTLPDLVLAFENYLVLDDGMKGEANALLACLMLERSLDADGYRVPLHDRAAVETGMAGDREIRELGAFTPTAPFFNLFSKDHRLELAIPFVGRDAVASWAKRRTGEQNDLVAKIMVGTSTDLLEGVEARAGAWTHPLLKFDLERAATPERLTEGAE
jgi:ParB family chromosome partitioning protein